MYLEIVDNKVIPDKKSNYIAEAKKFSKDLSEITGCSCSTVYHDDNSDIVTIMNKWNDKKSMESSEAGNVFLNHKSKMKPFFINNERMVYKEI